MALGRIGPAIDDERAVVVLDRPAAAVAAGQQHAEQGRQERAGESGGRGVPHGANDSSYDA